MINALSIKNFQSHKDTTLELDPGINIIVGPSDKGKSAIVRALLWAVTNRPQGEAFISHWAEECFVSIEKGAHTLIRERSKDANRYIVNSNILEALRGDVPEEVQQFFNLSEVNIQQQMDSPFLVSATAGEVARFFNKTIKLDDIDKCLALIESKKRKNARELTDAENESMHLTSLLEEYKGLDIIGELLAKAEKTESRKESVSHDAAELDKSIFLYGEYIQSIAKLDKTIAVEPMIKKVDDIQDELYEMNGEMGDLLYSIEGYNIAKKDTEIDLADVEKLYTSIVEVWNEKDKGIEQKNKLGLSLGNYSLSQIMIEQQGILIGDITATLPKICPTCGKPLGEK